MKTKEELLEEIESNLIKIEVAQEERDSLTARDLEEKTLRLLLQITDLEREEKKK